MIVPGIVATPVGRARASVARRRQRRRVRWNDRAILRGTHPAFMARPEDFRSFGRSMIIPPARVLCPEVVDVGDRVVIHEHAWFSIIERFPDAPPRVTLGDDVRMGRGCQLAVTGEVVIEDNVIIGDFVLIGDTFHPADAEDRMATLTPPEPVRVCRGAVIAGHVALLPGVTVGAGAYVGHHTVVNGDVAPGEVVRGFVPATKGPATKGPASKGPPA